MKQYYKANINGLSVKNLSINEHNALRIEFNHTVIKKDAIYFKSITGRLIEASNGCPTNTIEEAKEWLEDMARKYKNKSVLTTITPVYYVDENSLTPISINKEKAKILKELRKKRK